MVSNQKTNLFAIAIIVLIVLIAHFPTLSNDFVNWDDDVHVYDNLTIQELNGHSIKEMFTSSVEKVYAPLTMLSFAVEYHFVEDDPFLYHLTNVLLHILVVILIFIFAQLLGLSVLGAGICALLFGIHPVHVEPVAWVSERKDVLYSFFYMGSLCLYWKYLEAMQEPSRAKARAMYFFVGSVLLAALSMLSKPMALSLPLILFLLDWFKGRGWNKALWIEKIPFFLIAAGLGWITYAQHVRGPENELLDSILIWVWTFAFYLKQFFFPLYSLPIHGAPQPVGLTEPPYVLAMIIFGVTVLGAVFFRKNKWAVFAILYYFLSIFFLLRFDDVVDVTFVADRYMYLPSLGLCLLFGFVCQKLLSSVENKFEALKRILSVAVVVLMIVLGAKTYFQSQVWQNSITLWRYQLSVKPQTPIALNNLATALRDEQEYKSAEQNYRQMIALTQGGIPIDSFERDLAGIEKVNAIHSLYLKAIQGDEEYVDAYYNLGNLYKDLGLYPEAIEMYGKTILLDPRYIEAYYNLGKVFIQIKQPQKAVEIFDQMISLKPKDEDVYMNVILAYDEADKGGSSALYRREKQKVFKMYSQLLLDKGTNQASSFFHLGYTYSEMKDYSRAIDAYQMALQIDPRYVEAQYNLANTYDEVGDLEKALFAYKKVLALDPKHYQANLNLGVVYTKKGDYRQAKLAFEKALSLNSQNSEAHFNLGYIYEVTGQLQAAVNAYKNALKINPQNAEAYYNLGNVYIKTGNMAKAMDSYKEAISINPQHENALVNLCLILCKDQDYSVAKGYCSEARILGFEPPAECLAGIGGL